MITSFEVGAVFRIINEASPALARILKQVRDLNAAIDKAKGNLASITKMPALAGAIGETDKLAAAWGDVAANAALAQRAIDAAARRALPAAAAGVPGAGGAAARGRSGGGGRHRPSWLSGGGGAHISGPGASIPGGGHVRFGGAGMAAAGLIGYSAYEAAEMEDSVFQLIYHSGLEQNDTNRLKFRKMLQDSMGESGYSLHDISESAKQEIRMFQGTPGNGIDVLPEMLRAATIEARLKGESPEESMKALIGLAHMTKQYSPEQIKKLAPAFAFLSTANPGSLGSIEKAAGYAVPILQSSLDIDPMQTLLLGTALTRAGATSTKSGTWLREMALRAMPGTSMMSKMAFKKHEEALKAFGLVDDNEEPTWFTDGKPDLMKMLRIAHEHANSIPLSKRSGYERALFGAQGSGGFSLLADDAVYSQIGNLGAEMNSPEFKARYAGFTQAYQQGSTVQNARTSFGKFNNMMADLGTQVLPAVNGGLSDLKRVLEGIRGILPQAPSGESVIGARMMEGAAIGAGAGALTGVGMIPLAAGGAVVGGVEGVIEQYMKNESEKDAKLTQDQQLLKAQAQAGGVVQPVAFSLNIDGATIARALINIGQAGFEGQAPAFNGLTSFSNGDSQHSDK